MLLIEVDEVFVDINIIVIYVMNGNYEFWDKIILFFD